MKELGDKEYSFQEQRVRAHAEFNLGADGLARLRAMHKAGEVPPPIALPARLPRPNHLLRGGMVWRKV